MTIMPIPLAARALVLSWALTAATALNAIPVAAQPRPKASEPAAGSPVAARAAPLSSPRTRLAPKLITRAALSGASVSYTHLRAHETRHDLVCRLLLEK